MALGIQRDDTDLPEDLVKMDVALPHSARIESRWVQLKHPIEELLGGRMSIQVDIVVDHVTNVSFLC